MPASTYFTRHGAD